MALSAYNRSEVEKRAKQVQREAKIILAHIRDYGDDEQRASLNAIESIRVHLQAINEYLK